MTIEQLRARYLTSCRNCLIGTIYDDPQLEFKVEGGLRPFDRVARGDWTGLASGRIR
jgi:hypothetical protein